MSNDLGYPDIGLTTLKDVSNRSNQIARLLICQLLLISILDLNRAKDN